jgi:protein-disulfide isomerase
VTNARTVRSTREKAAQLRAEAARAQARRRNILVTVLVAVAVVAIVGVVVLVQQLQHDQAVASAAKPSGTPRNLLADGGIAGVGATTPLPPGKTPVTVTMWEDFQCPACRQFEQENQAQLERWAKQGVIKLEYTPVAFLDRASTTNYSSRALNTAAAVVDNDPSAFQAFHDLLYANQPEEGSAGLTDAQLLQYAVQAGAPHDAVASAQSSNRFSGWVVQRTEVFSQKYTGTPTVLVDGQVVGQSAAIPTAQQMHDAIAKAAAAKGLPALS